jgi:hypothetical protein
MEIWKQINNYPNYEISNMGNVRNIKTNKLLKLIYNHKSYYRVGLRNKSKQKMFMVHRLVAEYFILNPNNKLYVHHKNHIRNDNRVENLQWVTAGENERYKPSCKRKIPYDFLLDFYLKNK